MRNLILLPFLFAFSGCASDYELGDYSQAYCDSTDPEFRAQIKVILDTNGVRLGVDYCSAYGLVDALAAQ